MFNDLLQDYQILLTFRGLLLVSLGGILVTLMWKTRKLKKKGIDPKGTSKGASIGEIMLTSVGMGILVLTMLIYIISPELSSIIGEISLFNSLLTKLIGTIILALASMVYLLSLRDLGEAFRVGIPKENEKTELKSKGIYSYSRNPMVLSIFLLCLALVFIIANILACLSLVFNLIGLHLKVKWEEKFLESRFDQAYLEYKNRVKRYIPKIA